MIQRIILTICLIGGLFSVGGRAALDDGEGRGGFLFLGTDQEDFTGTSLPVVGPDRLGRFRTIGATVVSGEIIVTNYPINGMADGKGFLFAGDPLSNLLRRISYDGVLLETIVAGFPPVCCNEDMVFDGGLLYHAHYPLTIELVDPDSGAVVQTFPQTDVVGMTFVNRGEGEAGGDPPPGDGNDDVDAPGRGRRGQQIWITKWGARQVGIWDPDTNTFTPRFMTPELAGGLAWDPTSRILWVGLFGGRVVPYRLDGTAVNAGFLPFGPTPNTIDGVEFVNNLRRRGGDGGPDD